MCKKLIYLISIIFVLGPILTSTTSAELVGWWKFDDGTGTTAVDSSGNGNDATVYGNAQWIDGWLDGALQFDGVDDYIEVPDNDTLDVGKGDISFMLWIKQADDQPADHPRPISKMPLYATDKPGFDLITFGLFVSWIVRNNSRCI